MSSQLVKAFNALPKATGPSGLWHFDLRYNPLEPNPHHVLVGIQVHSNVIHVERLPVGLPADMSGIEFFPESPMEAAPEIALAILHIFVNKLNKTGTLDSPGSTMLLPFKLTMRDRALPAAVGREFKNLGVRPLSLHSIAISPPHINELASARLNPVFNKMKKDARYKASDAALIPTPESIGLWNFKLDPYRADRGPGLYKQHMEYVRLRHNTAAPLVDEKSRNMSTDLAFTMDLIEEEPEEVVKADADDGDPFAAFDYGMRLNVGLGCTRNRTLARYYIVKAAISPDSSDELRSSAHSFLVDWLIHSSVSDFRSRYAYAATHHANVATVLCRAAQPPDARDLMPSSPTVISFMRDIFERLVVNAPDLRLFCKDGMRAAAERLKQVESGQQKLQAKKMKTPLRYRCAAVGCGVEADKGKMLSQCAGRCDMDKKPSYCSKECQKKDWKNHKPFCMPGAECSVVDDGSAPSIEAPNSVKSSSGALQVPITLQDGSTTYVSSSTLDAQSLKEIRDLAKDNLANADLPFLHGKSIERYDA